MIEPDKIEILLKIHGTDTSASDEVIKSILLSASYGHEEIEKAISKLREGKDESLIRSAGLHKLFHTDLSLKPNEVHALLGIDIDISEIEIKEHRSGDLSIYQSILIIIIASALALSGVMLSMYKNKMGPFHPEVSAFAR